MVISVKKDGKFIKIPYLTAEVPVGEAPLDNREYLRKNGRWTALAMPSNVLIDEFEVAKSIAEQSMITANSAVEAISTLSGLSDSTTAMQEVAALITQINQLKDEVEALKDRYVIKSEQEYNDLPTKNPTKIYMIYEDAV